MKDVERLMGISYPTVKARLARLNGSLAPETPDIGSQLVSTKDTSAGITDASKRNRILDRLASGEISAREASSLLRGRTSEPDSRASHKTEQGDDDE